VDTTGPVLGSRGLRDDYLGGRADLVQRYMATLPAKITEAVRLAEKTLVPARVSVGHGHEETLAFNRRYHLVDGTVGWNPGLLNPKVMATCTCGENSKGVPASEGPLGRCRPGLNPPALGRTRLSATCGNSGIVVRHEENPPARERRERRLLTSVLRVRNSFGEVADLGRAEAIQELACSMRTPRKRAPITDSANLLIHCPQQDLQPKARGLAHESLPDHASRAMGSRATLGNRGLGIFIAMAVNHPVKLKKS
jgi:hypothetical protein